MAWSSYSDMDMLEVCNSGMWPSEAVPPLCHAAYNGTTCPGGSACPPHGVCADGSHCHPSSKAGKCPDGTTCPHDGVCWPTAEPAAERGYGWMRSRDRSRSGAKPTHPEQSWAEYRSQFSTFAILASPLILGNDPRNMSKACLDIIGNKDIIALNQDSSVSRAQLVYQWPMAHWPNASWVVSTALPFPPVRSSVPWQPTIADQLLFNLSRSPHVISIAARCKCGDAAAPFKHLGAQPRPSSTGANSTTGAY